MSASFSEFLHGEFLVLRPKHEKSDLLEAFQEYCQNQFSNEHESNKALLNCAPELLFEAFTHKSFAHESRLDLANNERLEFLGDSVLQLIISEELFKRYQNEPEGKLSKLRSSIVNEKTLSEVALFIGIDKLLMLGKGELKEKGHRKPSLISNCFEALLGAIHKSRGNEAAKEQALQWFELYCSKKKDLFDIKALNEFDAKSALQEFLVKKHQELPRYSSQEQDGKFRITVSLKGEPLGEIEHTSKKKGMQALAKKVLEQLNNKQENNKLEK